MTVGVSGDFSQTVTEMEKKSIYFVGILLNFARSFRMRISQITYSHFRISQITNARKITRIIPIISDSRSTATAVINLFTDAISTRSE